MSGNTRNALERLTIAAAVSWLAILALTAPVDAAGPSFRCAKAGSPPAGASLHFLRSSVLCLVNRARELHGLRSLQYNVDLRDSATGHSNDMVQNRYFSHFGSGGSSPGGRVARTGYLASAGAYIIGEDIGGGVGRRFGSPLAVFQAWMHSPPHRANILEPKFDDDGVGVARGFPLIGHPNAATYTLDLGMRR